MIKTDRLQAIRERANNATPGPWVYAGRSYDSVYVWRSGGPGYGAVAKLSPLNYHDRRQWEQCESDAKFIACAREDVIDLLNEVERLREESQRRRDALERIEYLDRYYAAKLGGDSFPRDFGRIARETVRR